MRKVFLASFLLLSPSTTAFSQTPDSTYAKWLLTPEIKQGFDFALSAAKLTYPDFTFRTDYWEVDLGRMNYINKQMTFPPSLPSLSLKFANQLNGPDSIYETISNLTYELSLLDRFVPEGTELPSSVVPYENKDTSRSVGVVTGKLHEKTKTLNPRFNFYYSIPEFNFIMKQLYKTILEDTAEEKLSVDALDSIQKVEESITRQFAPLVIKYNPEQMYKEFSEFAKAAEEAVNALEKSKNSKSLKEILFEGQTDLGRAIIGGTGSNYYKGDYGLIIDLGGDDTYELNRRPNFSKQIIIDLGGNDKYFGLEDYALACGYFGYSVLIDAAGDDLYQGKNFSVGCGFFGCGLLWDQAGNDTYIGDQFTQGAGGFGIGVLKDDGGNDRYSAARASQGFGFVRGVGALLDAQGSDNYFAGGKYKELLGLAGEVRYQSLSQGFATGLRPDLSGGMGFLFDYDGDDSYSVDMYGQGASYWWGLGALVDFKGNDRYLAQQYAQGAGVHMSLGVLVDSSGNDFYFSKGVSQGCGHDLGAGMLFDLYGNDNYVAADGSQAYGSANGFGILVDGAGNDGYYVKDKKTTQGVGNPRREYGSIAIFLDCGGTDHYDGNGGENRIWKPEKTTWGVGVDGDFGANDTLQVKK